LDYFGTAKSRIPGDSFRISARPAGFLLPRYVRSTALAGSASAILSVMNHRYISGARETTFCLAGRTNAFHACDGEAETLSAL
jgi:hypothetical protein